MGSPTRGKRRSILSPKRSRERRPRLSPEVLAARGHAPVSINIDSMAHGGDGVGRHQGRVCFVPGALVGDRWSVTAPPENRKKFWRPKDARLATPSTLRVAARCPHRPACGGCPWHELDADSAAAAKAANVASALQRIAGFEVHEIPSLLPKTQQWQSPGLALPIARPVPAQGWRLRARFAVKQVGKKTWAGFRQQASHRIVELDSCLMLHPALAAASAQVLRVMRENNWPSGQLYMSVGLLPKVQVAASFVLESPKLPPEKGQARHRRRPTLAAKPPAAAAGVLKGEQLEAMLAQLQGCDLQGVEIIAQGPAGFKVLDQAGDLTLQGVIGAGGDADAAVEGLIARHDPLSFTQAALGGNAAILASVRQVLSTIAARAGAAAGADEQGKTLELHAGAGNLSLQLAAHGWHVDAVENGPRSLLHLQNNVVHLDNKVRVVDADAEQVDALLPQLAGPFDLLVLDPPRSGYRPLDDLVKVFKFKDIIYVSCDPASLARDLTGPLAQGYRLAALQVIEMMPGSWHVETVVHLIREAG